MMVPFQHQLLILIGLYLEKSEHQTKTTFKVLIKLKHCQINFLKTLFNIDKWVTKYCYKKSVKHTPQYFCRNKVAAKQSNYQHKQINCPFQNEDVIAAKQSSSVILKLFPCLCNILITRLMSHCEGIYAGKDCDGAGVSDDRDQESQETLQVNFAVS